MTEATTTLARAWALVRRDGLALGFTDHDRDLDFDGLRFRAETGMTARALLQATGLSVDNTEAVGALSDAGLTEGDIAAGRYDGATITVWEVNWRDVASRRVLFRGTLGEITRAGGAFRVELRGLTEPLGQGGGRVFGAMCPAVLGDSACRFDLETPGYATETPLQSVAEAGAVLHLADLPDFEPGWFTQGRVRFLTGAAAGLVGFVRSDHADVGRRLDLWTAPGALPAAGDLLRIEAGCDKRFETCRIKFANAVNFQGFPDVPGEDWLIAAPRGTGA